MHDILRTDADSTRIKPDSRLPEAAFQWLPGAFVRGEEDSRLLGHSHTLRDGACLECLPPWIDFVGGFHYII